MTPWANTIAKILAAWLLCCAAASAAEWPAARYAVVTQLWSGHDPCGLLPNLHRDGHAAEVAKVRRAVEAAGVRPDYLCVHCPGAGEIVGLAVDRDFAYGMAIDGWWLARCQYPKLLETLDLWPQLGAEWDAPTWLYLGRGEGKRLASLAPDDIEKRIRWTAKLVRRCGFAGVFLDSSGNGWGTDPDQPLLKAALAIFRAEGLQVGCEAWPAKEYANLLAGCPVWLTVTHSGGGSFPTQHPLERAADWQAPPAGHVGMVHVLNRWGSPYRLTPELAERIVAAGGVPGVNYDQLPTLKIPARGPELREAPIESKTRSVKESN